MKKIVGTVAASIALIGAIAAPASTGPGVYLVAPGERFDFQCVKRIPAHKTHLRVVGEPLNLRRGESKWALYRFAGAWAVVRWRPATHATRVKNVGAVPLEVPSCRRQRH